MKFSLFFIFFILSVHSTAQPMSFLFWFLSERTPRFLSFFFPTRTQQQHYHYHYHQPIVALLSSPLSAHQHERTHPISFQVSFEITILKLIVVVVRVAVTVVVKLKFILAFSFWLKLKSKLFCSFSA